MKKIKLLFLLVIILVLGIVIFNFTRFFWDDSYLGEGGVDTPEGALIVASQDGPWANELVVKEHIDEYNFENMVEYLFINQYDDLCVAGVYLNSNGKWNCITSSIENDIAAPCSFILTGDPNQEIDTKYNIYAGTIYGWKLSTAPDVLINKQKTNAKTYTIKIDGKDWSIDYWWIDVVDLNKDSSIDFQYSK